jgi:hypothetical protein
LTGERADPLASADRPRYSLKSEDKAKHQKHQLEAPMPAACRADVEALLRSKKLDRTLVPMGTAGVPCVELQEAAKTGLFELDQQLGGGFPLGQMSEIVGSRSSGRTSLLMAVLAAATSRGEMVALVDTFDLFDPESAAAAGIDLQRMLWVRGEPCAPAFPQMAARLAGADRAIARALKAANLILQAGVFGVMALDLADAPPQALRRVPQTSWLRFQRVLQGQEAVGVILGNAPMSRSAGGVSISLRPRDLGFGIRDSGDPPSPAFALRASSGHGGASGIRDSGASLGSPGSSPASGIWDSKRVFRGLDSDVRVARARLVPGADASPVRLRASA